MIVLSPNPAYSLREQWFRLWRRSRRTATWLAANVVVLLLVSFGIPTALLVAGGLLTAEEQSWIYLAGGGLLTAAAIPFGVRLWRWGHTTLIRVAGGLVEQHAPHPDGKPPRVTRMEGRAFRELIGHLEEAEESASHARETEDAGPLLVGAERWQSATTPIPSRISLGGVRERIDVVSRVLSGGAKTTAPADVALFAEIAEVVIADVREAFRRALRREPIHQTGAMWPYVYDNLAREDADTHGGQPVAFRRWLEDYRRTNPP